MGGGKPFFALSLVARPIRQAALISKLLQIAAIVANLLSRFALLLLAAFALSACSSMPPRSANHYGDRVEFESIINSAQRRTVWGYLSMPKAAATAPVPALVLVHGSGGLGGREARYVEEYNKLGIATFVLAPFEVRGVKKTSEDQTLVTGGEMNSDAIGALRWLLADKRIDPQRIGIQGGSKGGNVALSLAFHDPFKVRKLPEGMRFALHIPIYPGCTTQHRNPVTTGKPILMLLGDKDDYTNPPKCRDYAAAIKQRGGTVETITYANAHHDFDGPDALSVRWAPHVQNASACAAFTEDDGSVTDPATGKTWKNQAEFQREYLQRDCMKRGAHVGSNAAAKKKSLVDITLFLKQNGFTN